MIRRFSLATLLLIMLVIAVAFGYLTWRADFIRSEVTRINKEEIGEVILIDGRIYPVVAKKAVLKFRKQFSGDLYVAGKIEAVDDVVDKFEKTAERMRELGADDLQLRFVQQRESNGKVFHIHMIIVVDDLDTLVRRLAEFK